MKTKLNVTEPARISAARAKGLVCSIGLALAFTTTIVAQGPYAPTNWPTSIDPNKKVHYYVADAAFDAPNANWAQTLAVVQGTDSGTVPRTICSSVVTLTGQQASTTPGYFNFSDTAFADWNTNDLVDVLVQVYGDTSLFVSGSTTATRVWSAREGTTGSSVEGGNTINLAPYATNIINNRWNWLLFTVTNKVVNDGTGTNRYIGSIPEGSASGSEYGGVNHGTLRFGAPSPAFLNGVTIHAIAFGDYGAFGTTNDVNQFEPTLVTPCDPVPDSNLVGIDFNAGVTNQLQVVDTDNQMLYVTGVGPSGDQRNAITPNGQYFNFGIPNNYLGWPCNPNAIIKVCVDFYDDPSFAGMGVMFGPENYATDALGCNPDSTYPITGLYTMQGTDQWVRKSWTISGVNLRGVNLPASLTGGPRMICIGSPVAVSRFFMAALRTSGPLAGQDPLADCYVDPLICQGVYGQYVELDLAAGVTNGLDLGSSSGDQTYIVEESGPSTDLRLSVRGDYPPAYNLNFVILTNALGPTSQGNAHLAMLVTYYDDPALVGQGFRPQVWKKEFGGNLSLAFLDPPQNIMLQGTGKWRDAYWEIGNIDLTGVNQSPQAAARFEMDSTIHISRVRYWVIRPCGATAGLNLLDTRVNLAATLDTNSLVKLSWPYRAPQAVVQGAPGLGGPWTTAIGTAAVESETSVFTLTNSPDIQFFRLDLTPP